VYFGPQTDNRTVVLSDPPVHPVIIIAVNIISNVEMLNPLKFHRSYRA